MTCVIALVKHDRIHMMGDKMSSGEGLKNITKRPKVFKKEGFIVGYSGSFRIGQLLEFTWNPPKILVGTDFDTFMYKTVVDSLKECMVADGSSSETEGESLLLGYQGVLYELQEDYSLFELENYGAVGCGWLSALSALNALDMAGCEHSARERLQIALSTSAKLVPGVSSEYDYITLGPTD